MPALQQIAKRRRIGSRSWARGNRASMRAVFAIYLVAPLVGLAIFIAIGLLGR
jgi:hypothetical protein